jgi:hypothetical protein
MRLMLLTLILGLGYVSSAFAMGAAPGRAPTPQQIAADPLCHTYEPKFMQGAYACHNYQREIERYNASCLVVPSAVKTEYALAKYAYMMTLYDREWAMLTRLHPAKDYLATWEAFKEKWRIRFANNPDVMALDHSELLSAKARGSLIARLNILQTLPPRAIVSNEENPNSILSKFSAGEIVLATALLLETLDDPKTKEVYAQNFLLQQGKDEERLEEQKNFLYLTAPEIVEYPMLATVAVNSFRLNTKNLNSNMAEEMMKPDDDGKIPGVRVRLERMLLYVQKEMDRANHNKAQFVYNLNQAYLDSMATIRGYMDDDYRKVDRNPKILLQDALILQIALNLLERPQSPTAKTAMFQQNLQIMNCEQLFSREQWAYINQLNDNYIGPATEVLFIATAVIGGGEIAIGTATVRALALRLLGRRGFRTVTTVMEKSFEVTGLAGAGLGLGNLTESLAYHIGNYVEASREFYENNKADDGMTGTKYLSKRSQALWTVPNAALFFGMPLLFLL